MLPFLLVLLVASSAVAAPTVELNLRSINEIAPQPSNGRQVGGWLLNNFFESFDNAELNTYTLGTEQTVIDIANSNNAAGQALALSAAIAIQSQLSTGIPGDACASANFITSYVNAVRSGNPGAIRGAVGNYVQILVSGIDGIVQFVRNPTLARFASGRRGGCSGGGSNFPLEAAWDIARSNSSPALASLLQETYCSAKSLTNGFTAVSRNLGAAITAAAQPAIIQVFELALPQVANLLNAAANNNANLGQAARSAQQALIRAVNEIPY